VGERFKVIGRMIVRAVHLGEGRSGEWGRETFVGLSSRRRSHGDWRWSFDSTSSSGIEERVGSGERQDVPHVPMACLRDELTNDNGHGAGSHPPGKFGRCDPDLWIHCEISYPAAYPGSFALEDEEGG
jgi:hypothetical protein